MPKRYIQFPPTILLVDPRTKESLSQEALDFGEFLHKLMANPLWNEGYDQGRAQESIWAAFEEAKKKQEPGMWLAEEDWRYLEQAAKHPRQVIYGSPMGPQVQHGVGLHPMLARQVVPMQEAIINAKTESEKARER